ncbi:hypothetical protein TSUD_326170 [Trifolium subterraneum]|uniref:Transmembrane protein n=1 Tax=Trifolium subterraneum TaxID=3900 RepID=A0A2Z6M4C2_TRISU|nr:hypothetical protein TSUD_326170 [Trifolium subterraneum]
MSLAPHHPQPQRFFGGYLPSSVSMAFLFAVGRVSVFRRGLFSFVLLFCLFRSILFPTRSRGFRSCVLYCGLFIGCSSIVSGDVLLLLRFRAVFDLFFVCFYFVGHFVGPDSVWLEFHWCWCGDVVAVVMMGASFVSMGCELWFWGRCHGCRDGLMG